MHFVTHRQINKTIRKGYGLLDLIGDIGGFVDALYYLFAFLFSPFWSFRYKQFLLTKLFRQRREQEPEMEFSAGSEPKGLTKLNAIFRSLKKIPEMSFLSYWLWMCREKRRRHQRLLDQSQAQLTRSLDLQTYIESRMMLTTAVMGL